MADTNPFSDLIPKKPGEPAAAEVGPFTDLVPAPVRKYRGITAGPTDTATPAASENPFTDLSPAAPLPGQTITPGGPVIPTPRKELAIKDPFNTPLADDITAKQLIADRDGFDPAQYLEEHPEAYADPRRWEILVDVFKNRQKEGLVASQVLKKVPEALFGPRGDMSDLGLVGQVGRGVLGYGENLIKLVPTGLSAKPDVALKKLAASTVTATGGLGDIGRKLIRKTGDLITEGTPITPALNPKTDEEWGDRLLSDAKMLRRFKAAETGANLPGAPLSDADAAQVRDMSTVDPATLVLLGGSLGAAGKAIRAVEGAGEVARVAPTLSNLPLRALTATTIDPALRLAERPVLGELATAAAVGAPFIAAQDKDKAAAGLVGLTTLGGAASLAPRLPSLPETGASIARGIDTGAGMLDTATTKINSGIQSLPDALPAVAGTALGFAIPGGIVGDIVGSVAGGGAGYALSKAVKPAANWLAGKTTDVLGGVSDLAQSTAYNLEKSFPGEPRLYRLSEAKILKEHPEAAPTIQAWKEAAEGPLGSTIIPDPSITKAMVFGQPVRLHQVVELKPKSKIASVIGVDPFKLFEKSEGAAPSSQKFAKKLQSNLDKKAGDLVQPDDAIVPLAYEARPNEVPVLLYHDKALVNSTIKKIFDTPDLLNQFGQRGFLNDEGTALSSDGVKYLKDKFDQANSLSVRDVGEPGKPGSLRKYVPIKPELEAWNQRIKANIEELAKLEDAATGLDAWRDGLSASRTAELDAAAQARGRVQDLITKDQAELAKEVPGGILSKEVIAARDALRASIESRTAELKALEDSQRKLVVDASAKDAAQYAAEMQKLQMAADTLLAEQEGFRQVESDPNSRLNVARQLDVLGLLDMPPKSIPLNKIDRVTPLPGSPGLGPYVQPGTP